MINTNLASKLYKWSSVLLIVITILVVWDSCSKRVELSALRDLVGDYSAGKLNNGDDKFNQTINKQNQTIIEQEQLILSQKDAIALNLIEIERLKKIKSQVRIRTIIDIDTLFIPYIDIDTFYIDSPYCLFRERNFFISNEHYTFGGKTKKDGVFLDSIVFNNNFKVSIANKKLEADKRKLFKKAKPIVEVVFDNPYVKTKSVNNIIIENPKKWYQKNATWFSFGIVLGGVLGIIIK